MSEKVEQLKLEKKISVESVDESFNKESLKKQHEQEALRILSEMDNKHVAISAPPSWDLEDKLLKNEAPKIEFVKENFSENFSIISK